MAEDVTENEPSRGDENYLSIEKYSLLEFKTWIIFNMAIRNKSVKKIMKKIGYIVSLDDDLTSNSKDGNICLETDFIDFSYPIENDELLSKYPYELEKELIKIANFEFDDYDKKLQEKFKNAKTNEEKCNFRCELFIVLLHLQDVLKNTYFILPDGYFPNVGVSAEQAIVDSSEVRFNKEELNSDKEEIKKKIELTKEDIQKVKFTNLKLLADCFFIYDYFSYNETKKIAKRKDDIQVEIQENLYLFYKPEKKDNYYSIREIQNKYYMMKRFIDGEKPNYRYLFLT